MLPADLPAHFRSLAELVREHTSDEGAAKAYEKAADAIEAAWHNFQGEALTLRQAAEESGYSEGHLQRLVAEGKIRNRGRKNRPRVRRGDLPKKVASASGPRVGSSPSERALLSALR